MSMIERMTKAFEQKLQQCRPVRSVHGPVSCRFHYRETNNHTRCVLIGKPDPKCQMYLEGIRKD